MKEEKTTPKAVTAHLKVGRMLIQKWATRMGLQI